MARKATTKVTQKDKVDKKDTLINPDTPLIFISHDTRDAELAEEFSELLRISSVGALKSFRSSDKKGNQGIEYGSEWYPAIMEKIEEATDVVCLLTHHSVDRPWILYEAGVAKGKLNKKVIGIALGISLSAAIKGPFAQFQNNDGDKESISKLVYDLVKKVPGLSPDEKIIESHVESFVKKAEGITSKIKTDKREEKTPETSVAKLFEEVKIMFDDLPSRIENRIDPEFRKKRKFHPRMMDEIFDIGLTNKNPDIGILMVLSFFKNDFPWVYDLGNETLKTIKSKKSISEKEKSLHEYLNLLDFTFHHPMMREMINYNKEYHFLFRDSIHILEKLFSRLLKQ